MRIACYGSTCIGLAAASVWLSPWFVPPDGGACYAQSVRTFHQVEFAPTEESTDTQTQTQTASDTECKPINDAPLWELTVDTQPVDQPGQIQLNPNVAPVPCPAPVMADAPTIFMDDDSNAWCTWPIWPGAQFCHRPLYFEEPCLERHGCRSCCPPGTSAAHFFCNAALLPIHMCQQPCNSCQLTPPAF